MRFALLYSIISFSYFDSILGGLHCQKEIEFSYKYTGACKHLHQLYLILPKEVITYGIVDEKCLFMIYNSNGISTLHEKSTPCKQFEFLR